MKKILTLLFLVICVQVFAQTYPITSITISLPANPDANTANWGSGTSLFTLTASAKAANGRVDGRVQESKILVSIKKGGAKVCGSFTANSAPASNFNTLTKVWSGSNAVSLLGQNCTLPPGEYELTVQFFGTGAAGVAPLSEEKTRAFSIRGNEQQTYQPPQAIAPANGTVLSEADAKKPITFRWTPLVPRPQEPVTYRVKVWQLMQGQNGVQAMKVNQPIITKDVDNITQTVITNLISGPCLPPYLCDFIWNVQALNREGKPVGGNSGMSEALKFNVQPVNDAPSIIDLVFPANGSTISAKDKPKFTWTHEKQNTESSSTYKIKIVEIIGDQSPEEALRTNKPHFEKDSLKEQSFQYPSSAKKFIAGKKYGWNVQVLNREGKPIGGNNGTSAPAQFKSGNLPLPLLAPFCTDFEDGTSGGWQVNNTGMTIKPTGGNPGKYVETTDQSGSSYFFNESTSYTGNWGDLMTDSCGSLCFDVNYLFNGYPYQGTNPPLTVTPSISIIGNGFRASFYAANPITVGDGWHSYCAPLRYLNSDGTMPSNADGHWVMNSGTPNDWNNLLSNVTRVSLPTDPTSYQAERFGFDNICIRNTGDCNPPEQLGSICGIKFNDLDGDGLQDPGEPGLPNWTINLAGTATSTATTNANGLYCFNNLPAGNYTVTETQQTGWQQTFPNSPGTHPVILAAGQNIENLKFGNRLSSPGSICDSLSATAIKSINGDCCWSLSLTQPSNTSGITGIQFLPVSPNSFISGTSQLGSAYTSGWLVGPNNSNQFTIRRQNGGNIPAGQLNNFFNFCLNNLSSPQNVVVNWLNASNEVVCSDTVTVNCDIPCVTITRDTIICKQDNYSLQYSFTNNSTFTINKIEVLQTLPAGITVTPSTLTIPSVLPGASSGLQTFTISGAIPNTTVAIIFKYTSADGCCSCTDTLYVTIPPCICEKVGASLIQDLNNCSQTLSISNNFSGNYFTQIKLTALTSGTTFSTWNTNTISNWYSQNTFAANSIQLVNSGNGFIPSGNSNNILDFSLTGFTSTPQQVLVEWIMGDSVICVDTLITNCIPPPPIKNCAQLIDESLVCLPDGSFQYKFKVKNNSTHTTTGFQLNPVSPLSLLFSPNNFSNVSIAAGMTSPEQTVIISGISPNTQLCFEIALYEHIFQNGELKYSWCCHSERICITTPPCSTSCDCGKWNPLTVQNAAGTKRYDCGSKILWSCKTPFQFTSSYQCSPNNESCQAKTTWEIKKGDVIIKSGTGTNNISDGFSLLANGIYTLTLNAECNGKKCPPCIYTIVVEDCTNTTCDCSKEMYVTAKTKLVKTKIACKETKIFDYGTVITLVPENICNPAECLSEWNIRVYDLQTGAFVTSGSGSGINSSFALTLNSEAGYRIELTGNCNGIKCKCEFSIRTRPK
ncbi:MAG: SdrD B-like domain-containing protein [Daejeonella sp.]